MAKAEKKQRTRKKPEQAENEETERGAMEGHGGKGCAGEESDTCVDCGKAVLATQHGLQCDFCGFWHHVACERVPEDVYSFLSVHNNDPTLLWHCRKCVVTSKKTTSMMLAMQEHQQQMEDRVSDLTRTVNKKIDDLAMELNNKLVTKEQDNKSSGDETQKIVEERFDKLIDTVKHKIDRYKYNNDDQEEVEESRKRRTNVILHGCQETTNENADDTRNEDEEHIVDLLHEIKCDDVSITSAIRLGKKSDDPVNNPRPLKIVLASEEQKSKVLRMEKNLRSSTVWQKTWQHQDLTPKQRERRQLLVKEMKQRQAAGEDVIIVNNKIVIKRT